MVMKFMYQNVNFTLEYEKSQAFRLHEKQRKTNNNTRKSLLVSNIFEKYFN